MPQSRTPSISREDGVTIVTLGTEYQNLDEGDLNDVQEVLLQLASTAEPPLVALNLQHTKFFGSAFIELLFRTWSRLHNRTGGHFAICGLTPYCREVIEVTHLDRLWDVCETSEEAARLLQTK